MRDNRKLSVEAFLTRELGYGNQVGNVGSHKKNDSNSSSAASAQTNLREKFWKLLVASNEDKKISNWKNDYYYWYVKILFKAKFGGEIKNFKWDPKKTDVQGNRTDNLARQGVFGENFNKENKLTLVVKSVEAWIVNEVKQYHLGDVTTLKDVFSPDKVEELSAHILKTFESNVEKINLESALKPIIESAQKVFNIMDGIIAPIPWKNNLEELLIADHLNVLKSSRNIILQGPPGTGKTRRAKILARQLVEEGQTLSKAIETYNSALRGERGADEGQADTSNDLLNEILTLEKEYLESCDRILNKAPNLEEQFADGCIRMIQFHPSYGYEDFIMGINISTENGTLKYQQKSGAIKEFAEKAKEDGDHKYVLIIDEINRAPLSTVMGELLYALENRGEPGVRIPAYDSKDDKLVIPENLYIIGTMNTADKSIAGMDYAMRRRFSFIRVNSSLIGCENITGKFKTSYSRINELFTPDIVVKGIDVEDIKLGQSYFICKEGVDENDYYKYKVKYEIVPILMEYFKDGFFKRKAKIGERLIDDIFSSTQSLEKFCLGEK